MFDIDDEEEGLEYSLQLARRLANAAIAHEEACGDSGMAVGDLEVLLGVAIAMLTWKQLEELWAVDDVRDLIRATPEYSELALEIYGDECDDDADEEI